jgi:hypothetical protein
MLSGRTARLLTGDREQWPMPCRDRAFWLAAAIALPYTRIRTKPSVRTSTAKKGTSMRWLRDARIRGLVLFLLAFIAYLVVYGVVFPLLWPYRDHPLVWFFLAFLSGNHLPELFPEAEVLL